MTDAATPAPKPSRTRAKTPAPRKPAAAKKVATGTGTAAAKPAAAKPKPAAVPKPVRKPKPAEGEPSAPRPAAPKGLTLLFIRHADAGDSAAWVGNDAERPLSKKGRKQAKRLGALLDRLRVRPDVLLASPRIRAADTAKLVGRRIGRESKVEARLDAGFSAAALESLVAGLEPTVATLAIVGHDPDFSSLASWLVDAPLSLAKGALVRVDLPERSVGAGRGALEWLLPPDAVPG